MVEEIVLTSDQIQQHISQLVSSIQQSETITPGEFAIVGIRTHGATLAGRLLSQLQSACGGELEYGILDITLYRDDLDAGPVAPLVRSTEIDFNIEGKRILLVDDVLYTGRTIRAALAALLDYGRPKYIKLAVLIDRGGRELPIEAQYIGTTLDVPQGKRVKLRMAEEDGEDAAVLLDG